MKSSLEITQKYFDLSNQADLDAIEQLIRTDATYSSDNTGLYFGKVNIMQMMRGFFDSHSQLQWQIQSIKETLIYSKFSGFHRFSRSRRMIDGLVTLSQNHPTLRLEFYESPVGLDFKHPLSSL